MSDTTLRTPPTSRASPTCSGPGSNCSRRDPDSGGRCALYSLSAVTSGAYVPKLQRCPSRSRAMYSREP
uniref:Uncharacterized protein n=1 Tax=uncultured Acidobacteria bacterium HF4000_26D02 TaxID=710731 RepID=E0XW56_9BACT|nr:hypothetical protein [uncultured Acidobacteria bacterium HF4000_26D02]